MTVISYVKPHAHGASAGPPYSVTLRNQSTSPWIFYVYQQLPNQQSANVFSLVWFASPFMIVPGVQIKFEWSIDYNFVWASTGNISPGVVFNASQAIEANPASANMTNFSITPGPNLSSAVARQPQGSLLIQDASTVPNNTFSVGIGMSDVGTFVTSAGPNLLHTFTPAPTPSYWIAAGTNVQVGTVLNLATVAPKARVTFPINVYAVSYTLEANNMWTPTS